MEKRGVVEDGLTPPEKSNDAKDSKRLEDSVIVRLSEKTEETVKTGSCKNCGCKKQK